MTSDTHAVMRYVHTRDPDGEPHLYRYEFFHIRTGNVLVSTITSSQTVPVTILQAQQEARRHDTAAD